MFFIIILFIVLVVIYIAINNKNMHMLDISIITISILFLCASLYLTEGYATERFENNTISLSKQIYEPKVIQEDYTDIVKQCIIYLTAFSVDSYRSGTNKWINVAYNSKNKTCGRDSQYFNFDNTPMFSRKLGVSLGTTAIIGPYCNNLGISLQSAFSIFIICKHGDFTSDNIKDIELLKLYANSSNNNGLSFYIKSNTVSLQNNNVTGKLVIRYTDDITEYDCLLNSKDTAFSFDRLNLSGFFIIKNIDSIRVLYMVAGDPTVKQLANINIKETTATFSNKELFINRLKNWKAYVYSFGIISEAISDNSVTSLFSHVNNEYLKATYDDFFFLTKDYNNLLNDFNNLSKCPYDSNVCASCSTITQWNNITQVLSAPTECKSAINTYCSANVRDEFCRCWDVKYVGYNDNTCKMFRNMFDSNYSTCSNISQDDINCIRNKYGLIYKSDCPVPKINNNNTANNNNNCIINTSNDLLTNTYTKYEYDKLKISGGGNDYFNNNPYTNRVYSVPTTNCNITNCNITNSNIAKSNVIVAASNIYPPLPVQAPKLINTDINNLYLGKNPIDIIPDNSLQVPNVYASPDNISSPAVTNNNSSFLGNILSMVLP